MAASGGGQPPQWLSTHPAHATRIRDLQDYAQRLWKIATRRLSFEEI
jgi:predicted Zn-dependent protease